MKLNKNIFMCLIFLIGLKIIAQKNITIDFQVEIDTIKNLMGVNRIPGNKIEGYNSSGISIIRLHDDRFNDYQYISDFWNYDPVLDSFTTINTSFDPTDSNYYHWDDADSIISLLKLYDFDIYFRLGISWPISSFYTTPPLDPPLDSDGIHFTKFAELCKRVAMHFNDGWNSGLNSNIKYWEIWNEPDGIFWKGSPIQFFRMFEAVSKSLKTYDTDLKIGGPAITFLTVVEEKKTYLSDFLGYLKDNSVPLDFYSWHVYGAENPYGIKYFADMVRHKLDSLGFTITESHLNEVNYQLGDGLLQFEDNAKGATYLLSHLITAQKSSIDKMFWYPGLGLFNDDFMGTANFKVNAYGMKTFSLIYENTPIQISTSGEEVIDENWNIDTTNFMILSGKSQDGKKVFVAISNYHSDYQDYNIAINNLPWSSSDLIKITQNIVKDPGDKFTESITYQPGGSSINLSITNMPSPSITFLRLENLGETSIKEELNLLNEFQLFQNYPNPFNPTTKIRYAIPSNVKSQMSNIVLKIYDMLGQEVQTLVNEKQSSGKYEVEFDADGLPSGVYFYKLQVDGNQIAKKMICLK